MRFVGITTTRRRCSTRKSHSERSSWPRRYAPAGSHATPPTSMSWSPCARLTTRTAPRSRARSMASRCSRRSGRADQAGLLHTWEGHHQCQIVHFGSHHCGGTCVASQSRTAWRYELKLARSDAGGQRKHPCRRFLPSVSRKPPTTALARDAWLQSRCERPPHAERSRQSARESAPALAFRLWARSLPPLRRVRPNLTPGVSVAASAGRRSEADLSAASRRCGAIRTTTSHPPTTWSPSLTHRRAVNAQRMRLLSLNKCCIPGAHAVSRTSPPPAPSPCRLLYRPPPKSGNPSQPARQTRTYASRGTPRGCPFRP